MRQIIEQELVMSRRIISSDGKHMTRFHFGADDGEAVVFVELRFCRIFCPIHCRRLNTRQRYQNRKSPNERGFLIVLSS